VVIDCHVHLLSEPGHVDRIVAEMDRLGIDKACLLAMQNVPLWGSRAATNEQLIAAYTRFPDRVIPFGYVDLGVDPVTKIDELAMAGCRGLKVTRTRFNYNDDRLMEYYARAAAFGLVMLFHTGTVMRAPEDQYYDIDSSRLRPIYLDRIARSFPSLKIIGAHLGNPWYDEAAMTLFWNPNVYFDLSGTTLARKDAAWFNETLWWTPERMSKLAKDKNTLYARSSPFERIVFGSDVPVPEMGFCMKQYKDLFAALDLPETDRSSVMGGTVAAMLGIKD
jgi:predicted TIM-barrel fold metal-dependent hydrolase